jgi:hypothetical protein
MCPSKDRLTRAVVHHQVPAFGGVEQRGGLGRSGPISEVSDWQYSQSPALGDDLADLVHVDTANVAQLIHVLDVLANHLVVSALRDSATYVDAEVSQRRHTLALFVVDHLATRFLGHRLLLRRRLLGLGKGIDVESVAALDAEPSTARGRVLLGIGCLNISIKRASGAG